MSLLATPMRWSNAQVIEALSLPSEEEMREIVVAAGWTTWYNDNYWTHPKTVSDPNVQDFTSYGLSLPMAYLFEQEKWPSTEPFRSPFPGVRAPEGSRAWELLSRAV